MELIVTVGIMAVLAAVLIPSFIALNNESRKDKDTVKWESVSTAIKTAMAEPEVRKFLENPDTYNNQRFLIVFDSDAYGKIDFMAGRVAIKFDDGTEHVEIFANTPLGQNAYQMTDREYQVEYREHYGYTLTLTCTPKTSKTTAKVEWKWEDPNAE